LRTDTTIDHPAVDEGVGEALGPFLQGIGAVVESVRTAQVRVDRVAATRFSVFGYFRQNENILSAIFADLLRPDGNHGQGDSFLRLFLQEIDRFRNDGHAYRRADEYCEAFSACAVETEHMITTHDDPERRFRRIDIVLQIGEAWIGVENKPWADEQDEQLKDYAEYLHGRDGRALGRDRRACVLYLSGDGSPPRTLPKCKRPYYRLVAYREMGAGPSIEHWIEQCLVQCEAENVRWFLKDLLAYVCRMFRHGELEKEDAR